MIYPNVWNWKSSPSHKTSDKEQMSFNRFRFWASTLFLAISQFQSSKIVASIINVLRIYKASKFFSVGRFTTNRVPRHTG